MRKVTDSVENIIHEFESPQELLKAVGMPQLERWSKQLGADWIGSTPRETFQKTLHGDDSAVPEAERLIETFSAMPASPTYKTRAAVVGGRPNVPAALTGHPMAMFRRDKTQTESAPLAVAISLGCSGRIDNETIKRRGIAALALVMRLVQERPVKLVVYCEHGNHKDRKKGPNYYDVITIPTAPLDLAMAAYCLTNSGFYRGLLMAHYDKVSGGCGGLIPWPTDFHNSDYGHKVRARLGLNDTDLVIPGLRINESERSMRDWVEETYKKFSINQGIGE